MKGKGSKMSNESNKKPTYVGVDDGHYGIKVVTEDGQMFTVPSRAKSGRHLINWQGEAGSDGGFYVTEEGQTFTAHEHLSDYDDTRFRDYPVSPLNRVLVNHALRRAGFAGRDVIIATGLPVSYYYVGSSPNEVLIEGKQANLRRGVRCESGPLANIVENIVTTEAIAAYFDQLINMDGSQSEIFSEVEHVSVGVIDVGGKTTDCAVILPGGNHVDTARSGSADVGVLKLNDRVEAALRTKFGFDNVPSRLIEQAIMKGVIKIYGREESVKGLVQEAKDALAEEVMSAVRAKIGSGKDLDWVLLVGGGSVVLGEQLKGHFPHCRIPDEPAYANARGMLKIAKYVFGSQAG